MEEKTIYKIEDVEVGDIVYYEGAAEGTVVVGTYPTDGIYDDASLKVETPEGFKPFTFGDTSVWLRNDCFRYAIRTTQNKPVEKSLPEVREGHSRGFETQSGTLIAYDGSKSRRWTIEPSLSDERLLELLDPSQFPLKNITEEEES